MRARRVTRSRTLHEDGATLTLVDRGAHHELRIGDVPILSSARLGTERAFGRLAPKRSKRVLVGGLGLGATLVGVLESVSERAEIVVVEKLETVIALARGEIARVKGQRTRARALRDPRVSLVHGDVRDVLAYERGLDAILLDVDNGPNWGSFPANDALYAPRGLRDARRALRANGIFAVWSGYAMDDFVARLRAARFTPSIVTFEERGKIQARAYVGRKR